MKLFIKEVVPAIMFTCLLTLAACDGDAENAGEKIDQSATDLGNKVEDACEDVKDGVNADDTDC